MEIPSGIFSVLHVNWPNGACHGLDPCREEWCREEWEQRLIVFRWPSNPSHPPPTGHLLVVHMQSADCAATLQLPVVLAKRRPLC